MKRTQASPAGAPSDPPHEPSTEPPPERELDVQGLDCPLPILRTKLALAEMAPGERIRVLTTDPHSVVDFKAYCARTGHELVSLSESAERFEFVLRRRGA